MSNEKLNVLVFVPCDPYGFAPTIDHPGHVSQLFKEIVVSEGHNLLKADRDKGHANKWNENIFRESHLVVVACEGRHYGVGYAIRAAEMGGRMAVGLVDHDMEDFREHAIPNTGPNFYSLDTSREKRGVALEEFRAILGLAQEVYFGNPTDFNHGQILGCCEGPPNKQLTCKHTGHFPIYLLGISPKLPTSWGSLLDSGAVSRSNLSCRCNSKYSMSLQFDEIPRSAIVRADECGSAVIIPSLMPSEKKLKEVGDKLTKKRR